MQIGQVIGINLLLLPHYSRNNRSRNWLTHNLRRLCLKQLPDWHIWVDLAHVGVVSQYLVSNVFGNFLVNIGNAGLLAGSVLVPLLLLFLFGPQLLYFLLGLFAGYWPGVGLGAEMGHLVVVVFLLFLLFLFSLFLEFLDSLHLFLFPVLFLLQFLNLVF